MALWLLAAAGAWAHEVNKSALLLLVARDGQGQMIGTGTGFIVRPDGTAITNYHVLLDAAVVDAVLSDGTRVAVASIQTVDRGRDFAIIRLAGGPYSTLELGDSTALREYDYVSALGYPSQGVRTGNGALQGTLMQTHGFVLGLHPQADPAYRYIYTTAPFGPGFSGGPLVNRNQQVVGLATLEGRAINLALPVSEIKPHLQENRALTFDQLREEDRASKEALYYRGNLALYGEGDVDKAIGLYRQALAIDPEYVAAHYDLAVAYRGLGRVEDAIAEYEKALAAHPGYPEALSNLGGQYFRQGKVDEAIDRFRKAIAVYPNFIQALSNLGAALNKQDQPDEALRHLRHALALDPEFAVTYFNLGNSLFALNRFDEAREAYQTAVRMGIDFLTLHWNLHEIYLKEGETARAREELEIILEIDPENARARERRQELQGSGAH